MSRIVQNESIPFIDVAAQRRRLGPRLEAAIQGVLDHGRFIFGPEVGELERRLEDWTGARHCITCGNGTDALILALTALGIGPGDAVLVPAFTFVASAEAVVRVGAAPVFVDVLPTTFNLDPASLQAAIEIARRGRLRPRAVIVVDLFGQPADYDSLGAIARAHGLKLIADAAQSFGATRNGRPVGTLADVTTTSFYPAKPFGCYGDGGALFTNDDGLARLLRGLRNHGIDERGGKPRMIGFNSRLDTLQAAILLHKLDVLASEIEARGAIARRYRERLAGGPLGQQEVGHQELTANTSSTWAQYTIVVENGRDDLVLGCSTAGVPTAIHYADPLHALPIFSSFARAPLPVSERLARQVVSLPMHAYLEPAVQDRIVDVVCSALPESERLGHGQALSA